MRSARRLCIGILAASGVLLAVPSMANADPVTDFLCSSGSAQFCPAPLAPAPEGGAGEGYKNCTEAWNAGVAPIYRGQAGYSPHLDSDNDGVACEKDPRR
ncbi:excalibur calcium-binding domain-containing protein [Antrihabitans cavernicola]|uniref:Excalibur calcium-binding domain-containing protein n=1 Tax=Antrihabitans cavernicola TaxID=2495913 RepID=A0A5A7SG96_9NOCA|nr:excalibur calcium-binding domain-containing protein [Spelaeibacter cavernicola]KAA0024594.1 excalibur calcium-binding domain-containing protein [Spelaeibacter cavernicola]